MGKAVASRQVLDSALLVTVLHTVRTFTRPILKPEPQTFTRKAKAKKLLKKRASSKAASSVGAAEPAKKPPMKKLKMKKKKTAAKVQKASLAFERQTCEPSFCKSFPPKKKCCPPKPLALNPLALEKAG